MNCQHQNQFENKKALSNHRRWCEGLLKKRDSNQCLNCQVEIHPQASRCGHCSKAGSYNPLWKGKDVGYFALHDWVKRNLIMPQVCRDCNQVKKLDLANISGRYLRSLSDWEWLCRKCHMIKDGRMEKLINYTKNNKEVLL